MLSIIKWEFIKTGRRLWGIVIYIIVDLLISYLIPVDLPWGKTDSFDPLVLFLSLSVGFCFLFLAFYPMYNMICDFRKKSYALERSSGVEMWKAILAKSIVNLAVVLLVFGGLFLASKVFQRFSTDHVKYLYLTQSERIPDGWVFPIFLIEVAIINPAQILFGYIMASTGRIFRNHRIIGTLLWLAVFNFITMGVWNTGNYLLPELVMALLLFVVAARRADRRYEQFVGNM